MDGRTKGNAIPPFRNFVAMEDNYIFRNTKQPAAAAAIADEWNVYPVV